ncbi:MAG: NAD-dependent epimerase/dehydratase family protein [Candidatus Heimdallarchaeum aukensis]|uniref:GDP-L-fucose synthase n=1 Tax=Candidatus Heimdallarchaeum aukensis TaxID=2876573 RepID=A0A9Y1FMF9_9ARCH|nr:MAG: NAD-dependent epimerase/dehydratase family protein [Candidatus Heimdallarchaeum aukensis]
MNSDLSLKDKKILLTGGSGFFGSFILDELNKEEVSEIIVPRSSRHDLRNRDDVQDVMDGVDIVIHAAGIVSGIGGIQEIPAKIFYDNAIMGLHIMEEAKNFGIKKLVNIGTACSYPKFAPIPLKEKDLWAGYPEETKASYGIAKRLLVEGARVYHHQYNLNVIPLIIFNLYGPRDNFDLATSHVIPALIRKCLESNKLVVWGDGTPTRSFLYVKDAAKAVILATKKYNKHYPVNIGTSEETSIKNLVELIAELTGFNGEIIYDKTKPNGQPRRCADVSLAKKEFNFEAKYSLKQGLKETIDWYKKNFN